MVQEHAPGVAVLDGAPAPEGAISTTLHELVAAQVRRSPDAVAVVHGAGVCTYRELDARARRLAARLRRAGVGSDERVAVCLPPGPELLVGLLGVLYAGGAYVPLGPATPPERARLVVADVAAVCLLTAATSPGWGWGVRCPVLDVDNAARGEDSLLGLVAVHPDNLAYVIYTSGSTGSPKGVMVPHGSICNTLRWRQRALPLSPADRVLVTFDYVFDASIFQLFQPLLAGAAVVFPDEELGGDPDRITRQVRRHGITMLGVAPSWLALLARSAGFADCPSLRLLFVGGEALPPAVLAAVQRHTSAQICSFYGPTEAAVDAMYAVCRPGAPVSLGSPIEGVGVRVLDAGLRACRPGQVGELYISGGGLARGYARDPGRTAARFLPDPFGHQPGGRMYATGDLCRVSAAGRLDYVGRRDLQVKVNGQRIEIEEIEAALEALPDVVEAAVAVYDGAPGRRHLTGFLVPRPGCGEGLELRARDQLRRRLPSSLIPSVLVMLPRLPRTTSGKKDRHALPPLLPPQPRQPAVVNRDPVTDFLIPLWRSVLDRPDLGLCDDFFAAGGTSIQVAILTHRLEKALGEYVYAVAVHDAPTIERMAAYLQENYPAAVTRLVGAPTPTGAEGVHVLSQADLDRLRHCLRTLPAATERPRRPPNPSATFILAPPRSGTTLLRTMLASHPALFAPPELQLLNFPTLRERRRVLSNGRDDFWLQGTVRAVMALHECDAASATAYLEDCERTGLSVEEFYRCLQDRLKGRLLVDKTPTYALDLATLHHAEAIFHKPHYIHLIRDAGAAVESFLEAKLHVFFPPFFREPPGLSPRHLAEAVWTVSHENITAFLRRVEPTRVHTVFFDDLVREPADTMRGLSRFLRIPFLPQTANPYTHDPRALMTDPVHPMARMLGDVKFAQHGSVRAERAQHRSDTPGGVPLSPPTHRIQHQLHAARARRVSSLVTLRAEGSGPALILVHAAGGGVTCYRHLVDRLGPGHPVHAHQRVNNQAVWWPGTLEELAATYVADLRQRYPDGPYHLGGWSFGGIVAFEMASQLIAEGEEVALLALLDARLHVVGAPAARASEADLIALFLRDHELDPGQGPAAPDQALAQAVQRGLVPPHLSVHEFINLATQYGALFMTHVELAQAYTPTRRLPRALFVAAERPPTRGRADDGWTTWVDDLTRGRVAGDHFTMLRPPRVAELAGVLTAHLRAAAPTHRP